MSTEYVVCIPSKDVMQPPPDGAPWYDELFYLLGHGYVETEDMIIQGGGPDPAVILWSFLMLYLLWQTSRRRGGADLKPLLAELKEIKRELRAQNKQGKTDVWKI